MTLRLFYSPASPYVRKVLVCAHERGLDSRIELLGSAAGPVERDANVVRYNASGKVPCMLLGNDEPLYDSRVICAYLDSLGPADGSLYPQDASRFSVLTLEALGDAILDASLLCRYEEALRPEDVRWGAWYTGQMAKVESGLEDLEMRWFRLLSSSFHAGAIANACALGYLDFRFPQKDWRAGHGKLAEWFETVSSRLSMKATFPTA